MKALILLCWLAALPALAGTETQNGGGAAEQSFAYALASVKPLYQACLATESCVRNDVRKGILASIYQHLDEDLAVDTLLRFESGAANPRRFQLDGQVRIAVTGSQPGSPIFVNRDLIYRRQGGEPVPYTVSEALGVLTHELGHHQGIRDHDVLDVLAGDVRAFFDQTQDHLRLDTFTDSFDLANVSMTVFHSRDDRAPFAHRSLFWLTVDDRVFDLNAEIQSKLKCEAPNGVPAKLLGYRFSHLAWGQSVLETGGRVTIPLSGQVWVECRAEDGAGPAFLTTKFAADIFLSFAVVDHRLAYREGMLFVNLERR